MRLVIALLFLTIFASRCFAFGAYAVGYDAKRKQFESFLILNRSTEQEAEDIALRACQNKSFTDCAIKQVPSRVVLEFGDAISGISRVSGQAARSIG